jgi:TRAP-type C4-dicarboxylate transport system substrate-binding protein
MGSAPLVVLMNRKKFESLPELAQAVIRKHSGEWAADRFIEIYSAANGKVLEQLKSEPKRKVIVPSAADQEKIKAADQAVIDKFVAKSPHNGKLLQFAKDEVAKLRSSE